MIATGRGSLLIAVLALLWGSNFLWIKIALDAFSPLQITAGRMVLGALVLLAVVLVTGQRLPSDWTTWGHLTVAALVANAVPYLLFAIGETRVDSGIAGALNATTPLWTLVLADSFGQADRPRPRQVTGLVLGFAGSLLIFAPWQNGYVDTWGALACLAAAFSYAVSYLYMARYLTPRNLTPTVLSTGQLIAASIVTAAALPFDGAGRAAANVGTWAALCVLGVLGTGAAYVVNYTLLRMEGPVAASVVIYLLPVVAITLGVLTLRETITVWLVLGVGLVLTAVNISRSGASQKVGRGRGS
ncbi:MAG: DMT family transporter [Labedaea sp.]